MMTALREWLTSVVTVTMLISISRLLVPEGTLRKIFSFTAGLVLMAALLQPLINLDLEKPEIRTCRTEIESRQAEFEKEQGVLLRKEVERAAGIYIQEHAAKQGLELTAEVTVEPDETEFLYR